MALIDDLLEWVALFTLVERVPIAVPTFQTTGGVPGGDLLSANGSRSA